MRKVTFAFCLVFAAVNTPAVLAQHEGHKPPPAKPAATPVAPKPKPSPAATPREEHGGHPAPAAAPKPQPSPVATPQQGHGEHAAPAPTSAATPGHAHDAAASEEDHEHASSEVG